MKYVLTNENIVFATHDDDQDIEALYPEMAIWQTDEIHQLGEHVIVTVTVADYDRALEKHLLEERSQRGYTTREPDSYINSNIARWKQDALDWISHKDQVMLYGLQVQNDYEEGKPVPTLQQFKQLLPKIHWTVEL